MYQSKKDRPLNVTSKDQRVPGGTMRDFVVVTGGRKKVNSPVSHSLRDMDPKTVEILVDDKIATGG